MEVREDVVGEDWLTPAVGPIMVCTVSGDEGYGTFASWVDREWLVADYPSRAEATAGHRRVVDGFCIAFGVPLPDTVSGP